MMAEGAADLGIDRIGHPGLNFDGYHQYDVAALRRKTRKAKLASVGGGGAYAAMVDYLDKTQDHIATVFFGKQRVFGKECRQAPDGQWYANLAQWAEVGFTEEQWHHAAARWEHPTDGPCGRHLASVPSISDDTDPKWLEPITGTGKGNWARAGMGQSIPCWCCAWMAEIRALHEAGWEIQCATSNIFVGSWISTYSAGSTELPEESFRNKKPAGWGTATIEIWRDGHPEKRFDRRAKVHPDTGLPLGEGCRWERQVLDCQDFPVYCYFMP